MELEGQLPGWHTEFFSSFLYVGDRTQYPDRRHWRGSKKLGSTVHAELVQAIHQNSAKTLGRCYSEDSEHNSPPNIPPMTLKLMEQQNDEWHMRPPVFGANTGVSVMQSVLVHPQSKGDHRMPMIGHSMLSDRKFKELTQPK